MQFVIQHMGLKKQKLNINNIIFTDCRVYMCMLFTVICSVTYILLIMTGLFTQTRNTE